MSKLTLLFFDRKSIIDRFQDETVNYISRKVIDSFTSIEKHEASKHRTRYTNEHYNKKALVFFVVLLNERFFSIISKIMKNGLINLTKQDIPFFES